MKTRFAEAEKVRVLEPVKILHGLDIITINPADVLRVVGYDKWGDVCTRFDNCADLEACHDALFGRFYIPPNNLVSATTTLKG